MGSIGDFLGALGSIIQQLLTYFNWSEQRRRAFVNRILGRQDQLSVAPSLQDEYSQADSALLKEIEAGKGNETKPSGS